MFRRFLTYCLLLLPVCTVMADGVDHLGSIRRIVRQDGVVERTNHYYPYGGLHGDSTGTTAHRFRFSGKEY